MGTPQFSNTGQAGLPANTLQACSLKAPNQQAVFFPTSEVMIDFDQAIGIHKHPNVPGAQIESLARGPIKFHIKALFYNGVFKGPGESWGNLFPDQYQNVLFLLMDEANNNQTKIFTHPIFGTFNVKAVKASTKTMAQERNGSTIEFDLIEANVNVVLDQSNLIASGLQAASDYDAQGYQNKIAATLAANGSGLSVPNISLSQAMGQITGALSQISMNINRVSGMITQLKYQCQQIVTAAQGVEQAYQNAYNTFDSFGHLVANQSNVTLIGGIFNTVKNISGLNPPTFNVPTITQAQATGVSAYPVGAPSNTSATGSQLPVGSVGTASNTVSTGSQLPTGTISPPALTSVGDTLQTSNLAQQDVQIVLAALNQLQEQAQAANQNNTSIFLVVTPVTLGQLATQLKTSVETLLQLNPSIANDVLIPYGTVIVYPSNIGG